MNIKVDREERPDVDRVYMLASQLLTGRGGWPNNVFLTPDQKPIFAGSYFPPKARTTLAERVDAQHGGFQGGGGTKFPMSHDLDLFFEDHRLNPKGPSLGILRQHLEAMAFGAIHDHLAGGFHRYSTEPTWSIPHFEKMLYDNAQLLNVYTRGFEANGDGLYRRMAEEIGDYLRRGMAAPEGGFYSAQDAEVGGREGASYLWSEPALSFSVPGARKIRPKPTP